MKYLKLFNESILDKMTAKSDEEVMKDLEKLSVNDKLQKAIDYNIVWLLEDVLKNNDISQSTINYWLYIACELNSTREYYDANVSNADSLIIVELLIKNGADLHYDNNIVFRRACANDNLDLSKLLIRYGADIHVEDDYFINAPGKVGMYLRSIGNTNESILDKMTDKPDDEVFKDLNADLSLTFKPTKMGNAPSWLLTTVNTHYDKLVMLFGEPEENNWDENNFEWRVKDDNGHILTIYDRLGGDLDKDMLKKSHINWHLGGRNIQDAYNLIAYIYKNTN